jgi:hypothetical protein
MNRLLQDNPVGIALAGTGAFLVFCMLVIFVWSQISIGDGEVSDADLAAGVVLELPELAESPALDSYSVIVQRPLFNESRQPIIEADLTSEEPMEELLVADDTELEVQLSGVVITPTLRMATLKRKDGSKSLVAFEGQVLEGEFGSWQLSHVGAREVTLVSGAGKELQLELQVHDERIEPPEKPLKPVDESADTAAQAGESADSGEPLTRAEEIRQRIAERREELRRQAEAEDQASAENAQPSYQEAIRAMINRRPAADQAPETENEQ